MNQSTIKYRAIFILFTLFSLNGLILNGQTTPRVEKQFEKAHSLYLKGDVNAAIDEAAKILLKDSAFVNAYLLLGDIYRELNETDKEITYLEKAGEITTLPTIFYRLGEAFYTVGNYKKALDAYENYLKSGLIQAGRKDEILRKVGNCRFAVVALENPVEYNPERLNDNINSPDDEYWPSLSVDQQKIVFTRLVRTKGNIPQEDFYISEFDSSGWGTAQPILEINTSGNEGAQSLAADGKLLFFTACNRSDGFGSCDLWFSKSENGTWSKPRNAGSPVNTGFWEAQPSLSADNKYLYFSSNRKGGKGQKDIWRAEITGWDANGIPHWGEPENIGDSINTPGDEISPFIHPNNKNLFFASDYLTGMGGFDLFTATHTTLGFFSEAHNLGYPLNTCKDEQGLQISADGKSAYFASARNPGTGLDIYSFKPDETWRPDPATYVKATILDKKTGKPVRAKLELVNLSEEMKRRSETADKDGTVLVCLPSGADYSFTVSEEGYLFYSRSFPLKETRSVFDPFFLTIELESVETGAEMNLYNIYFETDSFSILPPSEPELNKLVNFLQDNPDLKVQIQGHTDNSGNPEKNITLSERRARSVVDYLLNRDVNPGRLTWRGFGSEKPVADNGTEEGRSLNRRTTVKITGT